MTDNDDLSRQALSTLESGEAAADNNPPPSDLTERRTPIINAMKANLGIGQYDCESEIVGFVDAADAILALHPSPAADNNRKGAETEVQPGEFGWAPGGYVIKCRDCGGDGGIEGCDKRAIRCKPCAQKAKDAAAETGWLIEETWSGFVHYVHKDFNCAKWAAENRKNDASRRNGMLPRYPAILITKDVEQAMRFPSERAAQDWLYLQPAWMSEGDQFKVREHLWPALSPSRSPESLGASVAEHMQVMVDETIPAIMEEEELQRQAAIGLRRGRSPVGEWTMVPRDQTPEMIEAIRRTSAAVAGSDMSDEEMDAAIWSAQLAASPAQAQGDADLHLVVDGTGASTIRRSTPIQGDVAGLVEAVENLLIDAERGWNDPHTLLAAKEAWPRILSALAAPPSPSKADVGALVEDEDARLLAEGNAGYSTVQLEEIERSTGTAQQAREGGDRK